MNEAFISTQIAVYKNSKTLLEFSDKLKAASVPNYAHLHADGETDETGRKYTSLIGILMKDYSRGTGDRAVTVTCNISPEEAKFLFAKLKAGFPEYDFRQEKIFGIPDKDGYSRVTKLRIIRAPKDSKGTIRKNPWYFEVENGKGKALKNANGGTYMAPNSFVSENKVYASLTDLDTFKLLSRVCSYIDAWEMAVGPGLIQAGRAALLSQSSSGPDAA